MKGLRWILMTAALASLAPTPAPAASRRPPILVYRFPGATDTGNTPNTGTATVVTCTNLSSVSEDLIIAYRGFDGAFISATTWTLGPFRTFTVVTHITSTYPTDGNTATGPIGQGSVGIA